MTSTGGEVARTSQVKSVLERQDRFDQAERDGEVEELEKLLAPDFYSVGPKGYVMSKPEWIARHEHFTYEDLRVRDRETVVYSDGVVVVRNVQFNRATYRGETMELSVMTSQVWVAWESQWRVAITQFSPLVER